MPIGTSEGDYHEDHFDFLLGRSPITNEPSGDTAKPKEGKTLPQSTPTMPLESATAVVDALKSLGSALVPDYLKNAPNPDPEAYKALPDQGKVQQIYKPMSDSIAQGAMDLATVGSPKALFMGMMGAARLIGEDAIVSTMAKAAHYETRGLSPSTVKVMTGLERGAEGRWRMEINDSKIKTNFSKMETVSNLQSQAMDFGQGEAKFGRLPDVLDHPEFFKSYPEARKVLVVESSENLGDNIAKFHPDDNVIQLKSGLSAEEKKSAILHELQHWIQNFEGLPMNVKDQVSVSLQDQIKGHMIRKYMQHHLEEIDFQNLLGLKEKAQEYAKNVIDTADHSVYRSLASEEEAHNVQTRMNMPALERLRSPGYTTEKFPRREQTIIEPEK